MNRKLVKLIGNAIAAGQNYRNNNNLCMLPKFDPLQYVVRFPFLETNGHCNNDTKSEAEDATHRALHLEESHEAIAAHSTKTESNSSSSSSYNSYSGKRNSFKSSLYSRWILRIIKKPLVFNATVHFLL